MSIGMLLAALSSAEPPKRTSWGRPDFTGVWDSGTLTPLERPDSMKDREFLTEEEAEALRGTGVEQILKLVEGTIEGRVSGELSEIWLLPGEEVVRTRRTSLIIDPPNGKIPYTKEGRQRNAYQQFIFIAPTAPANDPEERHLAVRCLATGSMYAPNPLYLNHHEILQREEAVVLRSELMNEFRIAPLDGRPQDPPEIRRWNGSSRGHWEGETLVVETTNFTDKGYYFGSTGNLRTVERFTLVDADTIDYQVTLEDPASFTQPWTIENTLRRMDPPLYEFACHEGNSGMGGILRGARYVEREAARKNE